MVGGICLSLTIRDEVVELIRRRRWPKGVRCLTVVAVRNGRSARRLYA
ncbi:MAG: hypothetical protein QXY40_04940 [Candidatus Methanomethylicia archaeon]